MKIRTSFVSNSSSVSFVINKQKLSDLQLETIRNYSKIFKAMGLEHVAAQWHMNEGKETFHFITSDDNSLSIVKKFKRLGILASYCL